MTTTARALPAQPDMTSMVLAPVARLLRGIRGECSAAFAVRASHEAAAPAALEYALDHRTRRFIRAARHGAW